MSHPEANVVEQARDLLVDWIDEHRATCPHAACAEPENAIAYLAHCMGAQDFVKIQRLFLDYEIRCKRNPCATHGR